MKKILCVICSATILLSTLYSSLTALAEETASNDAAEVSQLVSEMSEEYNEEYEEDLEQSDSNSVTIDNRLIVKTDSKINTYGSVDEVYGLGYAFLQYETAEDADAAQRLYELRGLTVQNDVVYRLSDSSDSTDEDAEWAYDNVSAAAYESIDTDGESVIVGIIDTGIDIRKNIQPYYSRIIRTKVNFGNDGLGTTSEHDTYGHGTEVAGIIAKCTPDCVKLEGFRVDGGSGHIYSSSLICAYEYVLSMKKNRPDIINMSYVGYEREELEEQLIDEMSDEGIVLVASAGNDNTDAENAFPACNENVICVSSCDKNCERSSFSNYGDTVDIAAPGEGVYTTSLSSTYGYNTSVSGTSFSAPFVTAAAAIVLLQNKEIEPDEVTNTIKENTISFGAEEDEYWTGSGFLNISNCISTEQTPSVTFSIQAGEYFDTTEIVLDCEDENAQIIYTTDRTPPTEENGTVYTEPIVADSSICITAAAFSDDKYQSKITAAGYTITKTADESDFEISSDGKIISYSGTYDSITVPDEINGITPTAIGSECFKGSEIAKINLPQSVKTIGKSSFDGSCIKEINAPGVTECGKYSFSRCTALYKENMPLLETADEYSFYFCESLHETSFSDSIKEADMYSFAYSGLKEANFPSLTVEKRAFEYSPLLSANLPSVENLDGAFNGCQLLSTLNIPNVKSVGFKTFGSCSSLPTQIEFESITKVNQSGFRDSMFEYISLPNCESLGGMSFYDCEAETIDLPSCTEISYYEFCSDKLQSVNLKSLENITSTDNAVFLNCISLERIYVPKSSAIPSYTIDDSGVSTLTLNGSTPELTYIYAPKAVKFNSTECGFSLCDNLKYVFAPNLNDSGDNSSSLLPQSSNLRLYINTKYSSSTLLSLLSGGNYSLVMPWTDFDLDDDESSETAIKVDTDSMANALGRSICVTASGLRFGFSWENITDLEDVAESVEYGFIYSQKGLTDLSIDTVGTNGIKQKIASNTVNSNDNTTFNLVFTEIPASYLTRTMSARAYVCIDGMYFYSDVLTGSFYEVAQLVLSDDDIDLATKLKINNILNEV